MTKILKGIAVGAAVLVALDLGLIFLPQFFFTTLGVGGINAVVAFGVSSMLAGGLNAISSMMKGTSSGASTSSLITTQSTIRQPISYWRVLYGRTTVGGVITFVGVSSTVGPGDVDTADSKYLDLVITLTSHKVHAINGLSIDGVNVPLAVNGGGETDGYLHPTGGIYKGFLLAEFHNGDPSDTSQPFPGLAAAFPTAWTSNHLQRGRAKAHIRLTWDSTVFPSGLPSQIGFDISGREVYDPRTDTTGWSNNPALCLRDFLIDTEVGMSVAESSIDDDAVITAANICEESVDLKAGGTEQRYMCDGCFDTSGLRGDIISHMCTSMAGYCVPPGVKWIILAGAYREPVVSLTSDDVRGPIQLDTRLSRRDICNGIKGTYISAGNNYQPTDFPPYLDASAVAEDGGDVIWTDLTLAFTQSGTAAQRLAKIGVQRMRRQMTLTLPCKMVAYQLTPGDTVEYTDADLGFDHQVFEVQQMALTAVQSPGDNAPALGVDLVLRETDSSVYDWDPDTDENTVTDAPTSLSLPNLSAASPVTDLSLESDATTALTRGDGVVLTRILVSWTPPADAFVINGGEILIYWKPSSQSVYSLAGNADGGDTFFFISKDVEDGISYDVRVIAVTRAGARSAVSDATVTASRLAAYQYSTDYSIDNANFESSDRLPPDGWEFEPGLVDPGLAAFPPTYSFDTSSQFSGARSLTITQSAHSITGGTRSSGIWAMRKLAVRPGDFFTVSGAIRANSSGTLTPTGQILLAFYDNSDLLTGGVIASSSTPDTWESVMASGEVPAGSVYARLQLSASSPFGVGDNASFDDIQLTRIVRSSEILLSDGTTTLFDVEGSIGGGGGGSSESPATVAVTTSSLAAGATENDTLTMAGYVMIRKIDVGGKKCRIRLYSTSAARSADASRPVTTPLTPGTAHGCILDLYLDQVVAVDPWIMSPVASGANADAPQTSNIYAAITNMDSTSKAITLTVTYMPFTS